MSNIFSGLRFTCTITKSLILVLALFSRLLPNAMVTTIVVLASICILFMIVIHILNGFDAIRENTPTVVDVILLSIVLFLTLPTMVISGILAWNSDVVCRILFEPVFACDVVCLLSGIALICCMLFLNRE